MAQNEMKAMRGMPLRVPSMEGLAAIVADDQLHWDERNAMVHDFGASWNKAKPLVHGKRVRARIDRELAGTSLADCCFTGNGPKGATQALTLERGINEQVVEVRLISNGNYPGQLRLSFSDEVREVACVDVAADGLLTDRREERFGTLSVRFEGKQAAEAVNEAADVRSVRFNGTAYLHGG